VSDVRSGVTVTGARSPLNWKVKCTTGKEVLALANGVEYALQQDLRRKQQASAAASRPQRSEDTRSGTPARSAGLLI
jgi:hypothetical protein